FYGKQYPFIIEGVERTDGINSLTTPTITFISKAVNSDGRSIPVTFNKAIVYNESMCSGLLNLIIQDENDLYSLFKSLNNNNISRDVALRIREGHYNFSDFYDIFKHDVSLKNFFTNNWNNSSFRNSY